MAQEQSGGGAGATAQSHYVPKPQSHYVQKNSLTPLTKNPLLGIDFTNIQTLGYIGAGIMFLLFLKSLWK